MRDLKQLKKESLERCVKMRAIGVVRIVLKAEQGKLLAYRRGKTKRGKTEDEVIYRHCP